MLSESESYASVTSLMGALAEYERIRSVKDSLLEGVSGLLHIEPALPLREKDETRRCLKILRKFCQFFLMSLDYETALSSHDDKVLSELENRILEDLALYTGIISAFRTGEREEYREQISRLVDSIDALENTKTLEFLKQGLAEYAKMLEDLYKIAESRTILEEQANQRIILGNNGYL